LQLSRLRDGLGYNADTWEACKSDIFGASGKEYTSKHSNEVDIYLFHKNLDFNTESSK